MSDDDCVQIDIKHRPFHNNKMEWIVYLRSREFHRGIDDVRKVQQRLQDIEDSKKPRLYQRFKDMFAFGMK